MFSVGAASAQTPDINWIQSTEIYTNSISSFRPLVVFFGSANDPAVYPNVPPNLKLDKWTTVDLKPLGVAADAKFAVLGGIAIITGGADFHIALRAPGAAYPVDASWYQQQALSAFIGGGDRSVSFDIVPLVDGCFEIMLTGTKVIGGLDPKTFYVGQEPSVGINLKLKAWGR